LDRGALEKFIRYVIRCLIYYYLCIN
jgi:hypothetical protein